MLIKQGVILDGLHWRIGVALSRVDPVYPGLIVTSGLEGNHQAGSLHYQGKAIDFRKYAIVHHGPTANVVPVDPKRIKELVGSGFDLVDESGWWHLEYDPKPRPE